MHIEHIRQALTLQNDASVMLGLKKLELFPGHLDYLGHVIRPIHLGVSTWNIDAVHELEHTTSLTEPESFFVLCNGS